MPDELIIGLTLLIVVLTVIGLALYGLIALIARLFGGRARRGKDRRRCAFCGNMTPSDQDRCDWCNRDLRSPLAKELTDLDALERQLQRFRDSRALKPAVVTNLLARVERYRRGLLEPPTERPAAAPSSPFDAPPAKAPREEPVVAELVGEPSKVEPPPAKPAAPPTKPRAAEPVVPRTPSLPAPSRPAKPEAQPPAPPPAPPRSWAEMLAGFMEERNIRWGELIGGLLIVGSSVALVLSLWQTLSGIPYFPFFIFVASSSAVFGVGLYAHHRWKLESTSRGLLAIATLLVPLNFLFMALSSKDNWNLITVLAALAALGIFAWLVGLAGRVLVPGGRWLQALAVVGSSAAVLVVGWWVPKGSAAPWFVAAGCLPVALFGAAVGGYLYGLREQKHLDASRAGALFTLLGTGAFALLLALGLLGSQADGIKGACAYLSLPVALAAVPVLACGLTASRKMARDPSLAAYHTAGTTIALLAMLAMLAALGLAWPHPLGIIAVGGLNTAALVFAAFYYRLPILHAGAVACLTLAYLTAVHVGFDEELSLLSGGEGVGRTMLDDTFSGRSGTALGVLFVVLAAISELLARRGYRRHGVVYVGGCGVVAVIGLLLVTVHGCERPPDADALRAMALYAVYGAGSLAMTARWRRAELSYLGLALLTAASVWLLWSWHNGQVEPVWATVLAAEALLMGTIAAVLRRRAEHPPATTWSEQVKAQLKAQLKALRSGPLLERYRIPLLHVAEIVALAALTIGVLTAWLQRETPVPLITAGCLATLYLLLAWTYRSPARTWVGSMIVLAGTIHTLWFNYHELIGQPRLSFLVPLLAHSTLAVAAGVALDAWTKSRSDRRLRKTISRVFSRPLGDTALLSSALAVPLLAWELATGTMSTWSLALCLLWLAAVWLVISWRTRHAGLLAAHQAVLALAVLTATTAWLKHPQPWIENLPRDLFFQPQSLQAYGIALGLLSLVWIIARIVLRGDKVARQLLRPHGPAVDRIIRHAVVCFQLLLIGWHLLPGVGSELLRRFPAPTKTQLAAGGGAWLLLAVMAAVLIVTLWYRWRISMVSTLLLAATIPCLIAAEFAGPNEQAVASALRWGSALCFVVCSLAVWQRNRLLQASAQARAKVDLGPAAPRAARVTLLATTAAPVLVLTVIAAGLQMLDVKAGGPAPDGFFGLIGDNLSYLLPLLLVTLGLVGYAVRERSAGYAFSAGLVVEMMVTLGYALHVGTTGDEAFDTAELVTLIQLATITAAVWAGAWLAIRQRFSVWREESVADVPSAAKQVAGTQQAFSGRRSVGPAPALLMSVQLGMGAAGNALLLVAALLALTLFHQFGPDWQRWTAAAGRPLGWIALLSPVAAYVYRRAQARRRVHPQLVGLLGMAVLGLLACTIQGLWPQWGYRTLMLGWAMYAWFIVLATWWVATVRTLPEAHGPPQALIRAAAVWVRVAGILAVLLGLKAAFCHWPGRASWHWGYEYELLWAAAAIAVASAAGATMAVWRRQEGWAFSAALGVNLAASLVVWHFQHTLDFQQWWLRLVQANVIASAAVALAWLAARRRLYQLRELTLGTSPLLATQTTIPVVGNSLLLIVPVVCLMLTPGHLPARMAQLADVPGWLALLLAAAAAAWYLRQVFPGNLLHVLGGLGLGAGVLLASYTVHFNDPSDSAWLEYHTLTAAWAAVGLIVLGLGLLGRNLRPAAQDDRQSIRPTPRASPSATGQPIFPSSLVQAWVTAVGCLVLLLAVIHSPTDPESPWWSLRAIVSVSLMAGILAIWLRQPAYVFISGLLLCVIGVIAWMAWAEPAWNLPALAALAQANVLCLGVGSAVWSLLKLAHPAGVPHAQLGGRRLPYSHFAARCAVGLLAVVVAVAVASHVLGLQQMLLTQRLDWIALAATTAAVTICLWDRSSRLALPGLYALVLLAVGMGLCARGITSREFCHAAAIELAALVLAAAALGAVLPRLMGAWQALRIPHDDRRWPSNWLPAAQAVVAGTVALLSLWISLDFAFDGITHHASGWPLGRLAGPLAGTLLLPAAILVATRSRNRWREGWQQAALGLGLLILCQLGFVWLVPQREPSWVWLHRSVILMVAAVVMTLVASLGLRLLLPETSDWTESGRKVTRLFGGLALLTLAAVLVQEGLFFKDLKTGTPMAWPATVAVGLALAALAAACIGFAVRPDWDPLGLDERQRQVYVYAAEVLAGLIGLHIFLAMPWLFTRGLVRRFWMLIVMAVAFVGSGLSEWFQRRRMPVLSEPLRKTALLLPLAPAIGYWLMKGTTGETWFLGHASPAMWFLMGLFYGLMAVNKRSIWLGMLAVLAGNTGLWTLWDRLDIDIYEHPQLWLIPIALAALVAEYLNHDRLDRAQSAALRYLALSAIYVSSTADMFIAGVGKDVLTPLILMFLSVFGALAGILLRIRSFLYLGVTFLVLDIVTMVSYAAINPQTRWIAYVCGIALGIAVLILVGIFEKRRNDILAAMERLKDWER